eukprot:4297625-Ditylum_brightwellii.AAC.1
MALQADAVALTLTNQKNSQQNTQLHHHASKLRMCPVKYAAHLVHHMMTVSKGSIMPICMVVQWQELWPR